MPSGSVATAGVRTRAVGRRPNFAREPSVRRTAFDDTETSPAGGAQRDLAQIQTGIAEYPQPSSTG